MILKYFLEIKNRFILVIFLWVSLNLTFLYHRQSLFYLVLEPNLKLFTFSYFIFTNIYETLLFYLNLSYFFSNQPFLLFLMYHFSVFLTPGLSGTENRTIKSILTIFLVLWLTTLNFFHNRVMPFLLFLFLNFDSIFSKIAAFYFEAKIYDFLIFYTSCYYSFLILVFSLIGIFCLFLFLSRNIDIIKKVRKVYYYFMLYFLIFTLDLNLQLFLSFLFVFFFELNVVFNIFHRSIK